MKTIKSGITIMTNNKSGATFIADDFMEENNIGNRLNDRDKYTIEGELDVKVCDFRYKEVSHELWKLLDEIDGLSDQIKPVSEKGYMLFYEKAIKISMDRHRFLTSDGYNLELPNGEL